MGKAGGAAGQDHREEKLFQENTKDRMAVATTPGLTSGRAMRQKAPKYGAAVDQRRVFQVGGDVLEEGDHHPDDDGEAHDERRAARRGFATFADSPLASPAGAETKLAAIARAVEVLRRG